MRLSSRDPWDYLVEDPEVLAVYARMYGVDDVESVWMEDIPDDVWEHVGQQTADDEE